ncbi:MAG: gliding motility protein GldL [Bacteroidales bacterium]|nr:gliding motility protein GldL [Bacteroidales bacterium]
MMSISELVETDGWKKFMAKVYGWGASVVMIGALFKIQHYPGAGPMLVVGLLTEAVIFFFSAFEPVHAEIDWTLVYPELIPTPEGEEIEGIQDTTPLTTFLKDKLSGKIEGGFGGGSGSGKQGGAALEKFDELLEQGKLGPELFERLGNNLETLNNNVTNMNDISNAAIATNSYVENINNATGSVSSLSGAFASSADKLSHSVDSIATSAQQAANSIAESGSKSSQLIASSAEQTAGIIATSGQSYQQMLENLNANFSTIGNSSKAQAEQQEALTKNLSALNAVYELQLQNSSKNLNATDEITSGINSIMADLQSTANDVAQYKAEISKLSQNLSALNTVYGNMLNAMSIR